MTNTELREKLVELMKAQPCLNSDCNYCEENGAYCELYKMADFFIANGVTFAKDTDVPAKWISVKERLPEENGEYLISFLYDGVKMNEVVIKSVWINSESLTPEERGKFPLGCFHVQSMSNVKVTHWMPLPELPKAE